MNEPCHLGGLGVLVTRPAAQADPLCELIEAHHGRPIRFPTLEIRAAEDISDARQLLGTLADGDILVFVSANAADWAFPLLPDQIPLRLDIAAVGPSTAARLAHYGLTPTLVPEARFDSEGLLAEAGLQDVAGRRVIIIRGQGGRPLLGETLAARGAEVRYAEVYQAVMPDRNPANLVNNWGHMIDVVVASSNKVLDNLLTMLGPQGAELVRTTPIVVPGERTAEHADEIGCTRVTRADSATDADLLAALCTLA